MPAQTELDVVDFAQTQADPLDFPFVQCDTLDGSVCPPLVGSPLDVYVSSSTGNDGNAGRASAAPVATLAQAKTLRLLFPAIAATIYLKRGDTWRESYSESGTALANTVLSAYGTGNPPIVSGANVVPSWTKTVGQTNVYQTSQAHDATGTNRAVVVRDGLLSLTRVSSIANCDATSMSYFNADASAGSPMLTYVNVGGVDPSTDGHTYEVAVRNIAVLLNAGGTVDGVEAGPALDNNGEIDFAATAPNVAAKNSIVRYGTKHNILCPGGALTDIVAIYVDNPSASEGSVLPIVFFRPDATGFSYTGTRCHFYDTRDTSSVFFAHTSNDPAAAASSLTLEQCVVRGTGFSGCFGGGAVAITLNNCCGTRTLASLLSNFADTCTVLRLYGNHNTTANPLQTLGEKTSTPTSSWDRSAVYFNNTTRGIQLAQGGTSTFLRCSFVLIPTNFSNVIGFAASPTGGITVNRCVLQATNVLSVPTGAGYTGDWNVFVRGNTTGPFGIYHGTTYNLSTQLAAWRTATGQDANSIVLTTSPFTGTLANGDFTLNTAALTGAGHDGDAGPSDHWDYNQRAAVSGPPTRWPTVPTTLAEARAYVLAPASWNYYP